MKREHSRIVASALGGVAAALAFAAPPAVAQVAALNDYKCYVATEATLDPVTVVSLSDQFLETPQEAMVENAGWFCNPATKNPAEGAQPPTEPNHLTFYSISNVPPEPARFVTITNQFGGQQLVVGAPRLLAVPTEKEGVQITTPISHFVCYEARSPSLNTQVDLLDQFDLEEDVRVLSAIFLCNPAEKTNAGVVTPIVDVLAAEDHLVCYKITPSEQPTTGPVPISNQFDEADTLQIGPSEYLCEPSEKVSVDVAPPSR